VLIPPDSLTDDRPPLVDLLGLAEGRPGSVLLIRPSALGDVVRTVPLVVSLRRRFPGLAIDWLVQDSFVDAVRAHPGVRAAVPFPRGLFRRWFSPPAAMAVGRWVRTLARANYDLVIDAQGLARSGALARATGAAIRVGLDDAREMGWLGYTHRVKPREGVVHTVDRMLALVEALGATPIRDLRLVAPPEDRTAAERDAVLAGRFAVLAPTSRWPGKRWPIERFAALATLLLERGLVERVVVVGAGSEREECRPLLELAQREERVVDRLGRTCVGGLMATIERAALVVANDSAALHIAVGMGRPLVALFGPTDVAKVGPYGRDGDVLQVLRPGDRYDHKDEALGRAMMARIELDAVIDAARVRLSAG